MQVKEEGVLILCLAKTSDCAALYRTKDEIKRLITKFWEIVFQWIPSHRGIQGNDMVDTLVKDASNLTSPEEPTTYLQAVGAITRKSALLVFVAHKQQAKGKAWETDLENKLPSRSVFVTNFRVIAVRDYTQRHLNRIGLKKTVRCVHCAATQKK